MKKRNNQRLSYSESRCALAVFLVEKKKIASTSNMTLHVMLNTEESNVRKSERRTKEDS
jgi:hypothetical protein